LNNPYDRWFRRLDFLISGTQASFYMGTAAHLDLIPFATASKWGQLSAKEKAVLLDAAGNSLALTLKDSGVQLLVLNGASVVSQFRSAFDVRLESYPVRDWTLQAKSRTPVLGVAYIGTIDSLAGIVFRRPIRVLGFNHNIQSSYGVTREVMNSIKTWIGKEGEAMLAAA
jgi:hypothetical protein